MLLRMNLAAELPGLRSNYTESGGHSVFARGTHRFAGVVGIGPYDNPDYAEAMEAMFDQLASGENWTLIPLQRSVWSETETPLYVTAAPVVAGVGTTLVLSGDAPDMRVGQLFTVGDPDDPGTLNPRRIRRITKIERAPGPPIIATVHAVPPLPQQATGAGEAAALFSPATHVAARVASPGSGAVAMPKAAAAPGLYGPWSMEWIERVFTGGG